MACKSALVKVFTAIADQVDVIVCDANLFTKCKFKNDRHSDPATGAVLARSDHPRSISHISALYVQLGMQHACNGNHPCT